MGKGIFQKMAEFAAGAHPDSTLSILTGYWHGVYSGSKAECQAFQVRRSDLDTRLVGTSEIGEYIVVSRSKL